MEIEPIAPHPDPQPGSDPDSLSLAAEDAASRRRLFIALAFYAALAILAAFRLDGRPRLVVWIFLGLFVFRTLLLVLKQRAG